jgi:hypothetical protein
MLGGDLGVDCGLWIVQYRITMTKAETAVVTLEKNVNGKEMLRSRVMPWDR